MLKRITWKGWLCGVILFVMQYGLYRLANTVSVLLGTASHAFVWKIAAIDDRIPVIPVFVVPYIWSYAFWIMGPAAASLTKKENYINYICGLLLSYLIGVLFFTFMPTYMDRVQEGLMTYADRRDVFSRMLAKVYAADGAEKAFNLFPSFHCIISTYCCLGIRRQPEIPRGYRIYSLIMAVLIILSTLYTKQHYIVDSIAGVLIAAGCDKLMKKLNPSRIFRHWQMF